MRIPTTSLLILLLLVPAAKAMAQQQEPVGPFAADVRLVVPRFKDDAAVASSLGVASANLPGRGLGLVAGVHWYPTRLGRVTLGIGGEWLLSGASKTLEAADQLQPDGPTVNTRFSAITPQLSLNFGSGRGWSYLTAGLGWARLRTEREAFPVSAPASTPRVLNYGGGARWFAKEHLAFTLDLRFYAVTAQPPVVGRPAYPKMTVMVFSGGISIK